MTGPLPSEGTPRDRRVVLHWPLVYLGVAAVLALVVGLLTAATPPPATAPAGPAPVASAPVEQPCTGTRESLRPSGPLPPPGAMPAGSTMAAILARGRLVAGVDQSKYLTGYRNPQTGQFDGSDIDIVRSIAAALFGDPDRVQYVVVDIADRAAAVRDGRVDLLINDFTVTCERQRTVEFSTAYRAASARIMAPRGSGITGVGDLAGRKVCTSSGSTTEGELRALPRPPEVVSRPGLQECTVEMQLARVDAVASDDGILAGLAAQDPQAQVVGAPFAAALYGVGMRPDHPDLVRFVNAVLERDRADGSLAASFRRWLGGQLDPVPTPAPALYRD